MKQQHMISFAVEENFYKQLQDTINFVRVNAIHPTGTITFSRIVRIALADFIEKQQRIKKISEEQGELNKTGEEILRENARI